MNLSQGDERTAECADLMENVGVDYRLWHKWNVCMYASLLSESVLTLVDKITSAVNATTYIEPK